MANWLQARIIINVECFNAGDPTHGRNGMSCKCVCVWGGGVWVCVCVSECGRACMCV